MLISVCLALSLAACGDSSSSNDSRSQPVEQISFPAANGQDFEAFVTDLSQSKLVVAPSVSVLSKGTNRFGFGVFTQKQKQVENASVALYTANQNGSGIRGPFRARSESLEVKSQFRSRTTAANPDSAKAVYVASVEFKKIGKQAVFALVADGEGKLSVTDPVPVNVTRAAGGPPDVGELVPKVSTPTAEDVAGNLEKIDTRVPPGTMHDVDLADVLGKKPVVLVFATPLLCQSRVCGPVVDVAEQVKAEQGDGVAFIHMEIYQDNRIIENCFQQAKKCLRPQVLAYRLLSEPWTFVIDGQGKVVERLEGAFSARELERAVAKAKAAA